MEALETVEEFGKPRRRAEHVADGSHLAMAHGEGRRREATLAIAVRTPKVYIPPRPQSVAAASTSSNSRETQKLECTTSTPLRVIVFASPASQVGSTTGRRNLVRLGRSL